MRYGLTYTVVVMFSWLLTVRIAGAQDIGRVDRYLVKDAAVQAEISRIYNFAATASDQQRATGLLPEMLNAFYTFRDEPPDYLLFQLTWSRPEAHGRKLARFSEIARREAVASLLGRIPADRRIMTIASHLEGASEVQTRQIILLLQTAAYEYRKQGDFTECDDYLNSKKSAIPPAFLEFMYLADPRAAAVALTRLYQGEAKSKALAERVKKVNVETLLELSKSSDWWNHLYVIAKIKRRASLGSAEMMKGLKASQHPLVREALKGLAKD